MKPRMNHFRHHFQVFVSCCCWCFRLIRQRIDSEVVNPQCECHLTRKNSLKTDLRSSCNWPNFRRWMSFFAQWTETADLQGASHKWKCILSTLAHHSQPGHSSWTALYSAVCSQLCVIKVFSHNQNKNELLYLLQLH